MQQLNPSEISEIIKQRIDQLDVSSAKLATKVPWYPLPTVSFASTVSPT